MFSRYHILRGNTNSSHERAWKRVEETPNFLNKTDWIDILGVKLVNLSELKKILSQHSGFYVYILWKTYNEQVEPFYVGKGIADRVLKHGVPSDKANLHKNRIIKKHKKLNINIAYSIVDFYESESNALDAEVDLIEMIGRSDLQNGPLTNKTDGGDGTRGHLARKGSDSASARPVIANNQRYGSLIEASEALLVTSGAISSRINNGWHGYYYEDEGQQAQKENILGRYKKSVSVLGQEFDSLSEAARELNQDFRLIYKRINYGWPGYFYLDEGQKPRKTTWSDRKDKVPIIIRGIEYPTISDAVKATGESTTMISTRCLSSNFPDYKRKDGKTLIRNDYSLPISVEIDGNIYHSMSEAAIALDISDGTVENRCRNTAFPTWKFIDKSLGKEEFTSEFSSTPVPVIINGIQYPSQSEAARENSVDINTLKKRCASTSFKEWRCDSIIKKGPKDGRKSLIGVKVFGKNYRSINEAHRDTGISRVVIKRKIQSDEEPEFQELK